MDMMAIKEEQNKKIINKRMKKIKISRNDRVEETAKQKRQMLNMRTSIDKRSKDLEVI